MKTSYYNLSQEEKDLRLQYIDDFDLLCPVCKQRKVEEFYNGYNVDTPGEIYTYYCNKCGVVAKREVLYGHWERRRLKEIREAFDMVLRILYGKRQDDEIQ